MIGRNPVPTGVSTRVVKPGEVDPDIEPTYKKKPDSTIDKQPGSRSDPLSNE